MMGVAAIRSETDTTLWTVRRRLDIAAQPAQPAAHACCSYVCVLVCATPTHETESERVCVGDTNEILGGPLSNFFFTL